jgi:hypothetical protein
MSVTIPFRQEYDPALARVGGWLLIFYIVTGLGILAYLRVSMAAVITALQVGRYGWAIALVMVVAMIGLLRRKQWAYYLFVGIGLFLLVSGGLSMLTAPDQLLFQDWMFDMPILGEWLITLGWLLYFLFSKRVYSVIFGPPNRV